MHYAIDWRIIFLVLDITIIYDWVMVVVVCVCVWRDVCIKGYIGQGCGEEGENRKKDWLHIKFFVIFPMNPTT